MCGICGIFNLNGAKVEKATLLKMLSTLQHRGPDSSGIFIENEIGLGCQRLKIIDLEQGDQPIANENDNLQIVFNGEIYNYIELREILIKKGHRFKTKSDTEAILHSYEEWGIECVKHFNGMWAFALWDKEKKRLFLSRDRLGEKPIYYALFENHFYFSSEQKALLVIPELNKSCLELASLYLCLGFLPAPFTFYQSILKLKPGTNLLLDSSGLTEKKYWELPASRQEKIIYQDQAGQTFLQLFYDSLRLRLRADVPLGLFLSGGLDSSFIAFALRNFKTDILNTYTIGFKEPKYDERKLAGLVAARCQTNHSAIIFTEPDLEQAAEKILNTFDEPFGDPSAILGLALARQAKRDRKVTLSGDGGDEVLAGYPAYQVEKFYNYYKKLPPVFGFLINLLLKSSQLFLKKEACLKLKRYNSVWQTLAFTFPERLIKKSLVLSQEEALSLLIGLGPQLKPADYLLELLSSVPGQSSFEKLNSFQLGYSLPDNMLAKVDRTSMQYSLEVRLPFLDYRLVEYCFKLPSNIKMKGLQRKSLLFKTDLSKKLPYPLLKAGKHGFTPPLDNWWKTEKGQSLLQSLWRKKSPFKADMLKRFIYQHLNAKKDWTELFWRIFLLHKWLENRNFC